MGKELKYKVNDMLVITAREHGHAFKLGCEVKVIQVCSDPEMDLCYRAHNAFYGTWWVTNEEVKRKRKRKYNGINRIKDQKSA